MFMNRANRVIGINKLSFGGITGTVADIRLILGIALKTASTGIILSHNHPSGNLKPSFQDEQLTQKIKQAAELMDIKLLDHLIIGTNNEYISMADDGFI
jgi:DNA repair protein RadC